ncbi:MAG: cation-translocating P-type ATPase [Armatimonadota bacterium]|jgi:Ca2+-transporting ATPase
MDESSQVARASQPWNSLDAADVLDQLGADPRQGLASDEAERRLEEFGPNELERRSGPGPLKIFLRQFTEILVIVLLVAAAVSFVIGERIDSIVIMAIVIINAILGFMQEYRAEKAVEALRKMAAPTATVLRDGRQAEVRATEVVPGDVLVLETGDKIPSDARVIESFNLEADESMLTGESVPVAKRTDACPEDTDLAEQCSGVFMGTHITYGHGLAVVTATGMETQMGRIAEQVSAPDVSSTNLERKLQVLARSLLLIVCALCAIIFFVGWLGRGQEPLALFMAVVALAVAAIPEGLPAVVTVALAMSVRRMVQRHAIVKRLSAAEALGATTVICSDKTGTMTASEMAVVRIRAGGDLHEVEANGYAPSGRVTRDGEVVEDHAVLEQLALVAALCNDSTLLEEGGWTITGDPTEGALLPLARKLGVHEEEVQEQHPRVQEVAFDSERKRMSTIHEADGRYLVATKGAAEVIIDLCTRRMTEDGIIEMDEEAARRISEAASEMADDALRVLALAFREMDELCDPCEAEVVERDLIFLGLVGMIDPPRPEVAESIERCRKAGVAVKMVTGDHRDTAAAIARQIGLIDGGRVVDGRELDAMSDEELCASVGEIAVFARMAPHHKVRILEALQANGEIVGMTGDGINDAPALRRSDIGVGMARKGTDVTREVSDIVLADDNFASIVAAVEEGRVVYDNIRKFTRSLLSTNVGELLIIAVAVLAGWPLPLLPLQILWVNLVTDGLPALALGMTRGEPDIMERPPRDPNENMLADMLPFLVVTGVLVTLGALGGFLWEMAAHGFGYRDVLALAHYGHGGEGMSDAAAEALKMARTVALTQIVLFELFAALNCQSDRRSFRQVGFRNKYLFGAIALSILLHMSLLYVPALRDMFHLGQLNAADWGRVLLLAAPALFISPRVLVRSHGVQESQNAKAA